ncbi:hypothetical protein H5410_054389 [Solanum commersonii]|uniref:C-JID domain-containing protein n=1 Tax=Solanum commersonii TaxID=4109 RepID=A0A9J5WFX4_SOLCO|nr:hypothetical protein H5410_054389 [Solanum commersonii]
MEDFWKTWILILFKTLESRGGNNFEHLPSSIAQLGSLDPGLIGTEAYTRHFQCKLDLIDVDGAMLNRNHVSEYVIIGQHDIRSSHLVTKSLGVCEVSPQVGSNIGEWAQVYRSTAENWYESNSWGFVVCYSSEYHIDCITTRLIPFIMWDDGMSNDDGETNDDFEEMDDDFGENMKFGVRLLYKNESEHCIGKRKSRYEEEATCSSSKKQRP